MLKWLGGNSGANGGNGTFDNLTHVGKVFFVNEYQVVVEEVIAEGELSDIGTFWHALRWYNVRANSYKSL